MATDPRPQRAYAFFIAIGLLVGAAIGYYVGQPSAGTVIGGGSGALLAALLAWRDGRTR